MNAARAAERFAYRAPATAERSRAVTTRRNPEGPNETTVARLSRRAEEDRQAVQAGFDGVMQSLESIRAEIRRGAQDSGRLNQRLNDLEFQINMTRDEIQRNALTPGRVAAARTAINEAAKSPWARIIAFCVGFVAIASALNNIPDVARAWDRVWALVRTLDEPAPVKVDDKH